MDMATCVRRAKRDDGDPDGTVYIQAKSGNRTRGRRRRMYHDRRDCIHVRGESRTMTRKEAKQQCRAPCLKCVLMDVDMTAPGATPPEELIKAAREAQDESMNWPDADD